MIKQFPAYYVVGANTGIGKTLFSAGLCASAIREGNKTLYIKPIQTGEPADCDAAFVQKYNESDLLSAKTLFSLPKPLSPHRASDSVILDEDIICALEQELKVTEKQFVFVEGAGGVASPTPQGNLQCHLFRRIRLPVIFVADANLGGISTSISSISLLEMNGFNISCVLLFAGENENAEFLSQHYKNKYPVFNLENLLGDDIQSWLHINAENFSKIFEHLVSFHQEKIKSVAQYIDIARKHIWWPFTQHQIHKNPRYIDSAYNDKLTLVDVEETQILQQKTETNHCINPNGNISKTCLGEAKGATWTLAQRASTSDEQRSIDKFLRCYDVYDASASWWTQGIGHASSRLANAAAMAAGRYGHVMFPGNIHEPAAKLTQKLLNTVGQGWAQRVFFSDNGSTAVEVALKMAFKKSLSRSVELHQFGSDEEKQDDFSKTRLDEAREATCTLRRQAVHERRVTKYRRVFVLGLKDGYHGDTLGSMNATSPNFYKKNDLWYEPKGYWLDYPTVFLKKNKYIVSLPESFTHEEKSNLLNFSNEHNTGFLFLEERINSPLGHCYLKYISEHMQIIKNSKFHVGALLLEPIILGAGGMKFVDPLFQKILVLECRKIKIPVIFDEVFTGFWRLGQISAAHMLNIKPDIACYAKLLTGGLLPMSVTLASEDIFKCFLGESYNEALLHGHSYTATPVGCAVSLEAIAETQESLNFNKETNSLKEIWNRELVNKVSCSPKVKRVFALGSLFCLELDNTAASTQDLLNHLYSFNVDARPLGNVIYILAGFNSKKETLDAILHYILQSL